MSFTWTIPINQGDEIYDLAMQEIRDNCDYLDDNQSCLTYYGTINNPDYATYQTSFYSENHTTNQSGQRTSAYYDNRP